MTYRVGNHHGVTIVNETDTAPCGRPDHDCARGHLVAVVVNGDQELAKRICELLNDGCTGGAAEALDHVAVRIANAADDFDTDALATMRDILEATAAELGVDETAPACPEHGIGDHDCAEHAPPSPLSATETAQTGPARGSGYTEAATAISEGSAFTRAEYERWWSRIDDESLRTLPEPERTLTAHVLALQDRIDQLDDPDDHDRKHGISCRCMAARCACAYDHPDAVCGTHGPRAPERKAQTAHLIRQDYGTTECCHRIPAAIPPTERLTLHPDAATCGIAAREPERKADQA